MTRQFGLEIDTSGRLRLAETPGVFQAIWVAASGLGTIVKIDTESGRVLGEYLSRVGKSDG